MYGKRQGPADRSPGPAVMWRTSGRCPLDAFYASRGRARRRGKGVRPGDLSRLHDGVVYRVAVRITTSTPAAAMAPIAGSAHAG